MQFSKQNRMCYGKRRYPDEPKARFEAVKVSEKYFYTTKLEYYECPICRGFHLTSAPRTHTVLG